MTNFFKTALLFLCIAFVIPVIADGCENEGKYGCLVIEYGDADETLNFNYQKLVDRYKANNKEVDLELLRQAQRDWIKFRDSWCEYESTATRSPVTIYCMIDITKEQAEKLERSLDNFLETH